MRILITGARGLVGRALTKRFEGEEVSALGHRELDITDREAVRRGVEQFRPDVIFNCAVIGVDDCQQDPALAQRVNVGGPANLADAARESGAAVVHFSTNYVFDGRREPGAELYTQDDDAFPVNVYGRTKLDGERAVNERCPRAFIVRTSWVFGVGKESFLATVAERLRHGERVKAICDVWASATYVVDLVERLALIVPQGRPATYHIVNAGVCTYEEFALHAARITGASPSLIERVRESELMRSPRPRYTPMRCLESERMGLPPMRDWKEALAEYA